MLLDDALAKGYGAVGASEQNEHAIDLTELRDNIASHLA
jgi:hypothetical protein